MKTDFILGQAVMSKRLMRPARVRRLVSPVSYGSMARSGAGARGMRKRLRGRPIREAEPFGDRFGKDGRQVAA